MPVLDKNLATASESSHESDMAPESRDGASELVAFRCRTHYDKGAVKIEGWLGYDAKSRYVKIVPDRVVWRVKKDKDPHSTQIWLQVHSREGHNDGRIGFWLASDLDLEPKVTEAESDAEPLCLEWNRHGSCYRLDWAQKYKYKRRLAISRVNNKYSFAKEAKTQNPEDPGKDPSREFVQILLKKD